MISCLIWIDFYATWCGPCRMVAPLLKSLAKEYKDRIAAVSYTHLAVEFTLEAAPVITFRIDINLSALHTRLILFPVTVT